VEAGSLGLIGVTLLAQIAGLLVASASARLVPAMRDSAARVTLHLLAVIAVSVWWFPRHWQRLELISLTFFVFFIAGQAVVALLIFTAGVLLREIRAR
jgi:hypothetical protein